MTSRLTPEIIATALTLVLAACTSPALTPQATQEATPTRLSTSIPVSALVENTAAPVLTATPTATPAEIKPTAVPTVVATAATKELTLNAEQLQYTDHVLMLKDQATGRYKIPAKGEFTVVTDVATGKQTIKDKDNKVLEGFLFSQPYGESAKDWGGDWTKMEIVTSGKIENQDVDVKLAVFNTGELVTQNLTVDGATYTVTGIRVLAGDKQGFSPLILPVSIQSSDGEEFLSTFAVKSGTGGTSISGQAFKAQLVANPGKGFIFQASIRETTNKQNAAATLKKICGDTPAATICQIPAKYSGFDDYFKNYYIKRIGVFETIEKTSYSYFVNKTIPPADSFLGYSGIIQSSIG